MKDAPTVFDCSLIGLPRIENRAGNITPIHPNVNVPFDIRRVFYSFDIPGGEARGAHAHEHPAPEPSVLRVAHPSRHMGVGAEFLFGIDMPGFGVSGV